MQKRPFEFIVKRFFKTKKDVPEENKSADTLFLGF